MTMPANKFLKRRRFVNRPVDYSLVDVIQNTVR